ncbi:MAG: phosphoribosylanthranilate isomerase [Cyanobacteriota bacterium]|nr:phosphoribosylanthranilate isomerase [Cyanobacteriota bacterium]
MAPLLKICGLRLNSQAAAIARLGVDAIGVIAVESSPRWVPAEDRPTLFRSIAAVAPACRRVLVLANPDDHELLDLNPGDGSPTTLQLHGDESPERCGQLRDRLPHLELWKALRIRRPEDLAQAARYSRAVDALLLDAWVSDQLGGTGHRLPLDWLEDFEPALPWWLAGGIRADCVSDVLRALHPIGLDASSGVESAPALKDLAAVESLLTAVRTWPEGPH